MYAGKVYSRVAERGAKRLLFNLQAEIVYLCLSAGISKLERSGGAYDIRRLFYYTYKKGVYHGKK